MTNPFIRRAARRLHIVLMALCFAQPAVAAAVPGAPGALSGPRPAVAAHGNSDLVAYCAVPAGLENRLIGYVAASLGDDLLVPGAESPQLLLRHDGRHYDIVFDNGGLGQLSLSGTGAEVAALAASDQVVQVMVRQGERVEQYLFRFGPDGEGMLLWAAGSGAAQAPAAGQTGRAQCFRSSAPRAAY